MYLKFSVCKYHLTRPVSHRRLCRNCHAQKGFEDREQQKQAEFIKNRRKDIDAFFSENPSSFVPYTFLTFIVQDFCNWEKHEIESVLNQMDFTVSNITMSFPYSMWTTYYKAAGFMRPVERDFYVRGLSIGSVDALARARAAKDQLRNNGRAAASGGSGTGAVRRPLVTQLRMANSSTRSTQGPLPTDRLFEEFRLKKSIVAKS
jgi:hypothetical protein